VFDPLFEIPELRAILTENWQALPARFPGVTLDEFVIMPDHIHFIIHIEGNVEKPTTLHRVVGAYKSLTAIAWLRHLAAAGGAALEYPGIIWQESYHDRIIRDARELENTRQYIRNNPLRPPK
jgi:putative transposase